ncbi:transcript variant X1 [Nothobranchius furzeri]|uniref:Transcript variant X1 n=1 Tax=Nothobranchius furzeri TaxID=105023 RepID=A0A9D2Y3Y1_NOTFU|nr:transcript variant X1 [Nothobranchius furzeri]
MRGLLLLCLLGCVAGAPSQTATKENTQQPIDLAAPCPGCFSPMDGAMAPTNSSLGNETLNSTASPVKPAAATEIKDEKLHLEPTSKPPADKLRNPESSWQPGFGDPPKEKVDQERDCQPSCHLNVTTGFYQMLKTAKSSE